MFDSSPTFLNAPTAAILVNIAGIVPKFLIISSIVLRILVPPSIIDLMKSLFMTVFDNDSNEALKVLICQFIN